MLDAKSEHFLAGVDPRLGTVARAAHEALIAAGRAGLKVIDGRRSQAEQDAHVRSGASRARQGAHVDGKAIDVVPLDFGDPFPRVTDLPGTRDQKQAAFLALAREMIRAADDHGVPMQWGNDWDADGVPTREDPDERGQIEDLVHFQLPFPWRLGAVVARARERKRLRAAGVHVVH